MRCVQHYSSGPGVFWNRFIRLQGDDERESIKFLVEFWAVS
jgi:hypothetical protein